MPLLDVHSDLDPRYVQRTDDYSVFYLFRQDLYSIQGAAGRDMNSLYSSNKTFISHRTLYNV